LGLRLLLKKMQVEIGDSQPAIIIIGGGNL